MWASNDARFCGYCRYQFGAPRAAFSNFEYAGFWIRLVAFIIDAIHPGRYRLRDRRGCRQCLGGFPAPITRARRLQHRLLGRTRRHAGKMAVGIKVVMTNGEPIDLGAACLRYVGYLASGLILGIGYLMIAFSAEKKGLHDNIANTVVVKSR